MAAITLTPEPNIQTDPVFLSVADLWELEPICEFGLPAEMSEEMRETVQALVCMVVNPLRSMAPARPKEDR